MISGRWKDRATVLVRVIKCAASALWWVFTVCLALLMFNIIGAKMQGRVPSVFGYSVMNIISGSMGEEMPSGSYILVKRVDPEEIKENDIICFYSTDPAIYGVPNTHRVVEPPIKTDSGIEFVTKGDESLDNDSETAKGDRLIGLYVGRLYAVERLVAALDGRAMIVLIVIMQAAVVAMLVVGAIKAKHGDGDKDEPGNEK